MANLGLGGARSIDAFVANKLKAYENTERSFGALFDFMFSESENVMFERSRGYRVEKATYGEVKNSIIRRSAALDKRLDGVEKGAVVGIYLDNSREWIEVFWSVLMTGRSPLLMNMRLDKPNLIKASLDAGVCAVIAEKNEPALASRFRLVTLDDIAPSSETALSGIDGKAFGTEVIVMSSGTSDSVKLAYYTAENFHHMISDSLAIIKASPDMKKHYKGSLKQLAFLPFSHIFGLVAVYIWFAFFSRTFVLLGGMDKTVLIDTIRRHEVTHIFAVPLFWNTVYNEAMKTIRSRGEKTEKRFVKAMKVAEKLAPLGFVGRAFRRLAFREVRKNLFGSSIRFLITGGSEIDGEVLRFFNGVGYHLANGYGMTEIGITSVELSKNYKRLTSGSVGLPFASAEYRVDNGRLFVRGASCASVVKEGGEVNARGGDWFDTGDLAEVRDNRYYILGRSDDVVISPSGENLNPCLVENMFRINGVRECALVGLKEDGGVKPVLAASVDPLLRGEGLASVRAAIVRVMNENGLDGRISRVCLVRGSLMKDDEFKLNRQRIAKRIASGGYSLAEASEGCSDDGIETELVLRIRKLFAEALGKELDDVGADSDFFLDLGGSSLDFFGVVSVLRREYGIAFPEDAGKSLGKARDIAALIASSSETSGGSLS